MALFSADRFAVMGLCPQTGQTIITQAVMTRRQFRALKTPLVVWCSACHEPHLLAREDLRLNAPQ